MVHLLLHVKCVIKSYNMHDNMIVKQPDNMVFYSVWSHGHENTNDK